MALPPCDYKVIAREDVPKGAYFDTDFLQAYEDRAQSVHVDRVELSLRAIEGHPPRPAVAVGEV